MQLPIGIKGERCQLYWLSCSTLLREAFDRLDREVIDIMAHEDVIESQVCVSRVLSETRERRIDSSSIQHKQIIYRRRAKLANPACQE